MTRPSVLVRGRAGARLRPLVALAASPFDTERGSGELYSHLADYDAATLAPPFTPERYINATSS